MEHKVIGVAGLWFNVRLRRSEKLMNIGEGDKAHYFLKSKRNQLAV